MIAEYYRLAKPGIIYGNTLTTVAAFLYASRWNFASLLFFDTMLGIMLIIGSACVFNNYLDRGIDALMERTKNRALATGKIAGRSALAYASALGLIGFALLLQVNILTALVALAGFLFYVPLYTYAKRSSPLGTLVGSVSGAAPIVVGYTAVAGKLDATALILFLIMVSWQMPHFYAIAIRRLEEYRVAHIPILPAIAGIRATKFAIVVYILAYLLAVASLTAIGATGFIYLTIGLLSGFAWLYLGISGFFTTDDTVWARKLFLCSLIVLLLFSFALALGAIL